MSCDAYVSLHRSEGFGIGMAEAMLAGKPVVATAYGGNTDFLTERTGYPVGYRLTAVGEGSWPYDPAARWADPDLDEAAAALRAVVDDRETATARTRAGAELLRAEHSHAAAGARMARRLEAIGGRRSSAAAANSAAAPTGSRARRAAREAKRRLSEGVATGGGESSAANAVADALAELRHEGALAQAADLAELRRLRARIDAAHEAQRETQRKLDELRDAVAARDGRGRSPGPS